MAIKLQLKESYPLEVMHVANLKIVKFEARAYSRADDYLRKLASKIPAIMILEDSEDSEDSEEPEEPEEPEATEKINEMVTPESSMLDSFIEETKELKGDVNGDGKVDLKDAIEVIKNLGKRAKGKRKAKK